MYFGVFFVLQRGFAFCRGRRNSQSKSQDHFQPRYMCHGFSVKLHIAYI